MLLFLEETAPQANPAGGLISMLPMLLIMVALFYFMLIRPENKRKKEAEQLRSAVKNGDKITTIGGIVGTISKIKDEKIVIEIGTKTEKTPMTLERWAVRSVDKAAKNAADDSEE